MKGTSIFRADHWFMWWLERGEQKKEMGGSEMGWEKKWVLFVAGVDKNPLSLSS